MRLEYRPGGKENKNQRRSIRNSTPVQQILHLLGRNTPPEPEEEVKMSMDRANFVKDESSGVPLNEHLEPQRGVEGREVNFSPELYAQYENFLYNYSMKLSKLKQTPPPPGMHPSIRTMFDFIAGSPGGEIDGKFYESLIGNDGKPDEQKIEKFLETSEGWMLTTGMMEQQRALTMFAMGLDTTARGTAGGMQNAFRGTQENTDRGLDVFGRRIIRLGTGQGAISRLWNNSSGGQRWGLVGAVALGAGAAAVGGPIAGAVAGAVGGSAALGAAAGAAANVVTAEAGAAAISGILTGIQRGNYVDVHQCADAWQYIDNNPTLKVRLKYMAGLDADDYQRVGNNLEYVPGRVPQSARLEENFRTAMSLGFTAQQFYDSLGIDPALMDSSREEFILSNLNPTTQRGHEQGTTYLEERAMQLLNMNDPNVGAGIGRPGVPWMGLNVEERVQLYHMAKRKAMMEMFNIVTDKLLADQVDARLETSLEEIDRKISALSEGGDAETRLKEPLNNEKNMIGEVLDGVDGRNGIRPDLQSIEAFNNALRDVRQARDRLRQVIGTDDLAAIDRELNLRNGVTTERLQQLRTELASVEATLQAQIGAGEAIDNRHAAGSAALDRLMNVDAQLVARGLPPVGLNRDVLRSESTDEIIRRINNAHIAWGGRMPPLAEVWFAGENMNPIHRTRLYMMIAEAQARENPAVNAPSAELTLCVANNLSENFLRTATTQEIADRMRAIPALAGLAGNTARINELSTEAQTRFSVRANAIADVSKREEADRTEFNASLGARRTQLDTQIQNDRNELATLENEERALAGLRNLDTQSAAIFATIENDYTSSYDRISNWHTVNGIADLAQTSVATYDVPTLRGVLAANGLPLPPDPAAANRFLISAISEAQARQAGGNAFTDEPAGVTFAIASLQMTERQVRDWSDNQIVEHMKANRIPSNLLDAARLQEIRSARAELQARRDARTAILLTNIRANPGSEANFLRTIPDYRNAEAALTNHLTRLGVPDRAALQNRIDTNTIARAGIRELDNRVANMLTAINTEDTTYANALNAARAKRTEIAGQLNGANSIAALDRLINMPVDEIRALRETIVNSGDLRTSGQTLEQYYNNAREFFSTLEFNPAVIALYAPGRELRAANLATLTLQEAMTRLNELNAAGRAAVPPIDVGWPATDNDIPENRIRLARAMEEARWRNLNGAGNPDFNATVLGSGMPEHLVLSMTPQEMIAEINRRAPLLAMNAANPADIARAEAFKVEAQRRLTNRVQSMNSMIDSANGRARAIDRDLNQPSEAIAHRRQELEEMKRSILDRGDRMAAMNLFIARPNEIAPTMMGPVGAMPDLTAAENGARDAVGNPLPRAMVEMYQVLFNYRQGPDREAVFNTLLRNMPPQQLIDTFVAEIPQLSPAALGPPANADQFITRLRMLIDRRLVTSHEMRRVVAAVNNNFEGRALAMAA